MRSAAEEHAVEDGAARRLGAVLRGRPDDLDGRGVEKQRGQAIEVRRR